MSMINATNMTAQQAVEKATQGMVADYWLAIALLAGSILIMFLGFIFLTPIGKESIGRWFRKKKYAKGGYTNALFFTKDGLCKEVFKPNNDGYFRYNDQPYVRVPNLTFPFKGIPTLAYIEGASTPIDVYEKHGNNMFSCHELDTVMNQQSTFDVKEWLRKNTTYIIIFGILVIGGLAATIFLDYNVFEWIRDSAPDIAQNVKSVAQSKVN